MPVQEAANDNTAPEAAAAPPTLRVVLEPLLQLPEPRPFAARHLLLCLSHLEHAQKQLRNRKAPEVESLSDQDSMLLSWLAGVYHGISGSQAIIHGELLQPEFTASGVVAPFVQPLPPTQAEDGSEEPATGARFGVPSNTDALCDNASELLRMAAAALISLYTYLHITQDADSLPADEVTLTFATIAIHSCAAASNAAGIDTQLQQLIEADVAEHGPDSPWQQQQQGQEEQPDGQQQQQLFGCAQVRWLMHYVRGLVAHYMAAVHHVLGDSQTQADCYQAQQKDMQYMCKALPDHPLGYSLFARCAMNGQQMAAAQAFLARGLAVAQAVGADTSIATMSFQRAAALLLGGGGPTVDAGEVQGLLAQGEAARESVLGWFPQAWIAAAEDGDPDRRLVLQKLLPGLERVNGVGLPDEGPANAMVGVLYVTRPDAALPKGALQHVVPAGGGEDSGVQQ